MNRVRIAIACCFLITLVAVQASAGMEMPAEMQAAVTQYPGSEVLQIVNMGGHDVVLLDCGTAALDEVYEYYLGKVKGGGWEIVMESKQSDFMMLMAMKDGSKHFSVNVNIEDGSTVAALSLVSE
jgi:hypothetical protein